MSINSGESKRNESHCEKLYSVPPPQGQSQFLLNIYFPSGLQFWLFILRERPDINSNY